MNTQRLLSIFSRQNAAPFTFFFLLIVVAVFGFTHSSATAGGGSGQGNQRPPMPSDEELKKDFDDEDLKAKDDKPAGKWSYTTLLDSKLDDPSVPAYVRGIQIVSGGGKYQGINKIKRVQVANRTSLTIVSVQVRVEVADVRGIFRAHAHRPERLRSRRDQNPISPKAVEGFGEGRRVKRALRHKDRRGGSPIRGRLVLEAAGPGGPVNVSIPRPVSRSQVPEPRLPNRPHRPAPPKSRH